MNKVLLVDDDEALTAMLGDYLRCEGFTVAAAHDGQAGAESAIRGDHDIVVLDVMMPTVSGIEALRRIRASSKVPVLMLTARGDNIDRIAGLDLGADDYVQKPCTPGELVARLRAILRRTSLGPPAAAPAVIRAGKLTMWPSSRKARWIDEALELTGTEFSLLEVLARQGGRLVSKQDLSLQAYGRGLTAFDRRIDVHLSSVRQKLGVRADGQSWIQSVRGVGYQLIVD